MTNDDELQRFLVDLSSKYQNTFLCLLFLHINVFCDVSALAKPSFFLELPTVCQDIKGNRKSYIVYLFEVLCKESVCLFIKFIFAVLMFSLIISNIPKKLAIPNLYRGIRKIFSNYLTPSLFYLTQKFRHF